MSTAKSVCEAAEAEPGVGALAGPADITVKDAGGEVALNGMDASGACHRLTGVMGR